ncbi:hypothetical protein D9M71_620770 [compost metagenome]
MPTSSSAPPAAARWAWRCSACWCWCWRPCRSGPTARCCAWWWSSPTTWPWRRCGTCWPVTPAWFPWASRPSLAWAVTCCSYWSRNWACRRWRRYSSPDWWWLCWQCPRRWCCSACAVPISPSAPGWWPRCSASVWPRSAAWAAVPGRACRRPSCGRSAAAGMVARCCCTSAPWPSPLARCCWSTCCCARARAWR